MPKWVYNPSKEPLKFHTYQDAFWKARRQRVCRICKVEYASPPESCCPQCGDADRNTQIRKFHRLTLLAGRRGGKTKAGAIAGVEEASIPNTIGWCCAPTNPKLHRYVIPAFQQLIPPEIVKDYSSEHHDLWLKNGSLIHFQTLEDPDQGRGQGLDWLWIDEICELSEDHWHVIRPSLTERRGVAFFTSSPQSYDWVWKNFYKKAEEEVPGFWAARYATSENPIISEEEIAEAKATMPDAMFRQEYEADFVYFEGAVYGGDIDPQILKTNDQVRDIIPEWPEVASWRQVLVGIDTGADHPFGAVKLISSEQGLVVVGEYLERHRSFIEHAGSLRMLAGNANTRWAINRNERQPMIELGQHQIFCQPAENDVVAGTERVKSWLHTRQLWFVESQCPMTIQQLKAYHWAKDKTLDGQVRQEKVYKRDDELPDCLRYALMTWPQLPKPVVVTEQKRDISMLPTDIQATILRMRKIDAPVDEPPDSITGDFYGY